MAELQRHYYTVYTKREWLSGWMKQPYIEPLSIFTSVSPGVSRAQLAIRFGAGNWEDGNLMVDAGNMADLTDNYVAITASQSPLLYDEKTLFMGILGRMEFALQGQTSRGRSSDQILNAYGLETLLETRITAAFVEDVATGQLTEIGTLPTFNSQTVNNAVEGNMSKSDFKFYSPAWNNDYYTRVFAGDKSTTDQTDIWSIYDMIVYLTYHNQIPDGVGGPRMGVMIPPRLVEYLKTQIGVFNFGEMTTRNALNLLAHRSRGLCWWVETDGTEAVIRIDTMLNADLEIGDVTVPASTRRRRRLDLWNNKAFTAVRIMQDDSQRFDKIIVRGSGVKICGSWRHSNSEISKGWLTAEQTKYEDAAKNESGYSGLSDTQKAALNDSYRGTDKFNKVFTTFHISSEFDWTLDGQKANPRWNPETATLNTTINAAYFNTGKRFLNMIPLKEGCDYSAYSVVNNNPNNDNEFRRPFVLAKNVAGKYVYVDKIQQTPASVRMLQTEPGVVVKFNPAYLFSGTSWTDEIGNWTDDFASYGLNYTDMILTAMIDSDQRFEIIKTLSNSEFMRTKIIQVNDAELWYVVPNTIIDVDAAGGLVEYGSVSEIRNDAAQLETVLASAAAWYGLTRYKVRIKAENVEPLVNIGDVLEYAKPTNLDGELIGSVITAVGYSFTGSQVMSIQTDNAELDIAGIHTSGRNASPTIPSLTVAAREINAVKKTVNELLTDKNRTPIRIEAGGSGGGGSSGDTTIRKAYAKADAGTGKTITCYLDTDATGDEITVNVEIANGGANLNASSPLLEDGDMIHVIKDGVTWRAVQTFDATGTC